MNSLMYHLSLVLEFHSKQDCTTTSKSQKNRTFSIRPYVLLSMSRKWLVFAGQLPACNYLDSKSARPSRLWAKSNRTINQREAGRTRGFPPVFHIWFVACTALSDLPPSPSLEYRHETGLREIYMRYSRNLAFIFYLVSVAF